MTALLDASLLIPLVIEDHTHHDAAVAWFSPLTTTFATCPITQGALLRFLIRGGVATPAAMQVLEAVTASPAHEFWPDEVPYFRAALRGVVGHRQVTDAYLVTLARHRGGRLATFDAGLASLHPDVADLVPAR